LKAAVSEIDDFTTGTFQPVLGDQMTRSGRELPSEADAGAVRRVLLCSGKVYYDLAAARKEQDRRDIAIVRVEQLYPLPVDELRAELARFPDAELVWVQEEPANQGGWPFIALNLPEYLEGRPLLRASRRASASPAVGSMSIHEAQQREIVAAAFA
ncbi:MAG TPA: multifunctional oxoglutarate decarboxylase/oxoglutarate dehydrogenase thiamine pyrophosphate-binding subunit/dihydrolipoyllysine-residue succinyltransferase subunit, partial [Jatrophihabitantaceae bacterium]